MDHHLENGDEFAIDDESCLHPLENPTVPKVAMGHSLLGSDIDESEK